MVFGRLEADRRRCQAASGGCPDPSRLSIRDDGSARKKNKYANNKLGKTRKYYEKLGNTTKNYETLRKTMKNNEKPTNTRKNYETLRNN